MLTTEVMPPRVSLPDGPLHAGNGVAEILVRDRVLVRYREIYGRTRYHRQPGIEIHLTHRGRGRFLIGDQVIEHRQRQAIVFAATRPHQLMADDPKTFQRSVICFDDQALGSLGRELDIPLLDTRWVHQSSSHHLSLSQGAYLELDRLCQRMHQEQALSRPGWQAAAICLLGQALVLLSRCAATQKAMGIPAEEDLKQVSRLVSRGCAYVRQHLDGDLSLDAVSQWLDVSPEHLTRSFRLELGLPFHRYALLCRVNEAKRLLRDRPDHSLTRIALDSGFGSSSQFSRAFRQWAGQSPSSYRSGHLDTRESN
jgi:AraC-like DNA-binding protein